MDSIGVILKWQIELFGRVIEYSPVMLLMTWSVMLLIVVLAILATRNMKKKPGKLQMVMELFYKSFRDLTYSTLGEDIGKPYVNYVATLFIFLFISNSFGIFPPVFQFLYLIINMFDIFLPIPDVAYMWMANVPVFQEPTKFLSTTLGLGILSAVVVHVSAIRIKGIMGYLRSYMDPLPSEGLWMLLFWINPFFYLNLIGEFAKVVSHSFRLFGNILGGSIIIIIVSHLTFYMFPIPVFLNAFFGVFTGTIQAFVFTMLAVTYIAVTVSD